MALVWALNTSLGSLPALGKLLDPVNGWAANAEPVGKNYSIALKLKGVKSPATIWLEDRLVPHIRAANNYDLYFAQGYIHAYFRLWQMEFQTHAAAGRIGEVVGEKWITDEKTGKLKNAVLEFDRGQRRKGMVYGAEQSLQAMEADPRTKEMLDAYTVGINSYIASLSPRQLPIEYKLMGYAPEPWTNLKCALLLKYMADDLTGYTEDFPLTVLRDYLPKDEFEYLYPQRLPGSIPVIPEGTQFAPASLPKPVVTGDSVWVHINPKGMTNADNRQLTTDNQTGIGSNNWAISGAHTASGAAILCNDPHLGLNLPCLWFEVQLTSPDVNVYGASLPGAPGVVIGFNDSISWGVTNNYRDVKDFYEIEAIDDGHYRFDGHDTAFIKRKEYILIKGKPEFVETIDYTIHGPVIYDEHFADPLQTGGKYALQWMAHRPTNELLGFYLLNRAKDYNSFVAALQHYQCPAQNFVYADRSNNIAMWGQGQFINKWQDQGRYLMKGNTSATLWGQDIPMMDNPHALNPPQGYLASANQMTTDSTYPYWYNGYFSDFRAWEIHREIDISYPDTPYWKTVFYAERDYDRKRSDDRESPVSLRQIQLSEYSILNQKLANSELGNMLEALYKKGYYKDYIAQILPFPGVHEFICGNELENIFEYWSINNTATYVQVWWYYLQKAIWADEFIGVPAIIFPKEERTMQLVTTETNSVFYDNKQTPKQESLTDVMLESFKHAIDSLNRLKSIYKTLEWYKVKGTTLTHLAKLPAFSYKDLKVGGWGNTINAVKKNHGPSWRMIVEMGKDSIKAYGVYPGGQSGNPGSKHYGDFISHWTEGEYYGLNFLASGTTAKPSHIPYTITIQPQ